jgi:hypothetical protein
MFCVKTRQLELTSVAGSESFLDDLNLFLPALAKAYSAPTLAPSRFLSGLHVLHTALTLNIFQ